MNYAVIKIKGHQYKVLEGDEILVDSASGDNLSPQVLLLVSDKKVQIGKPIVKNVKVDVKVLEEVKGEKLYIHKFKAKSRYRRKTGFRPKYTKLLIEKIS